MPRLPIPGSDDGQWGYILNDFLIQEHNTNGSLKIRTDGTLDDLYTKPASGIPTADIADEAITGDKIADSTITANKLSSALNSDIANAQTAVQAVNGKTGQTVSLEIDDLSDVTTSAATEGQALTRVGSNWAPTSMIPLSQKAAPSGVASLDSEGHVPVSQIPTETETLFIATMFKDPLQTGHGTVTDDDTRMYLAESTDGINFTMCGQQPAFSPPIGSGRDFSLINHGGWWFMAYTWDDVVAGAAQFRRNQVARSKDLVSWQIVATIDGVDAKSNSTNMWAPQWFKDDDGKLYLISSVNGHTGGNLGLRPYVWEMTSSDGTTFSLKGMLTRTGTRPDSGTAYNDESAIDACIIRHGGQYHAFVVEMRTKYIEHWSSSSLLGPWTVHEGAGNALGFGTLKEAPVLVQLANGNWRIYVDHQSVGTPYYSESADLDTWTPIQQVSIPGKGRHLNVIRATLPKRTVTDLDLARSALSTPQQGKWWAPVSSHINSSLTVPTYSAAAPYRTGVKRVGNQVFVRVGLTVTTQIPIGTNQLVWLEGSKGHTATTPISGTLAVLSGSNWSSIPIIIWTDGNLYSLNTVAIPVGATIMGMITYWVGGSEEP